MLLVELPKVEFSKVNNGLMIVCHGVAEGNF